MITVLKHVADNLSEIASSLETNFVRFECACVADDVCGRIAFRNAINADIKKLDNIKEQVQSCDYAVLENERDVLRDRLLAETKSWNTLTNEISDLKIQIATMRWEG